VMADLSYFCALALFVMFVIRGHAARQGDAPTGGEP